MSRLSSLPTQEIFASSDRHAEEGIEFITSSRNVPSAGMSSNTPLSSTGFQGVYLLR